MSAFVSNTDFADISAFANEVKKAFETATPPIVFSIDKRENVEPFAKLFQSDSGFLGKRVSCKNAKNGSFGNFSLNELYSFDEERYPIEISFKQLKECEDFANGWIRLVEKENAPAEEPAPSEEPAPETPPVQDTSAPDKNTPFSKEFKRLIKGDSETRIRINSLSDIKIFTDALKQVVSLEGVNGSVENTLFTCRFTTGGISEKKIPISEFANNLPLWIVLNNMEQAKQFAVVSDSFLSQDNIQEKVKVEEALKTVNDNTALEKSTTSYSVNPLAENILDSVLKALLIVGWILAIGVFVLGIALAMEWFASYLLICLAAPVILLFFYFIWARGKIIINISRNLFEIRNRLNSK